MINKIIIPYHLKNRELSDREKDILRTIIHLYILNAAPIGSRYLSKYLEHELKLSPASIRNIMSDLEEMDYISHPHTSAGRIPTDKGYRFYVDTLMNIENLSDHDMKAVTDNLVTTDAESILRDASKILGFLSRCLSIVEIPHLTNLIVEKIELVSLSATRILVVLALDSKIIRTVTLEADFELSYKELEKMSAYINEKISGKPLNVISKEFKDMIADGEMSKTPLIRLFIDSITQLFAGNIYSDRLHIAGTQHLLEYPEFEDVNRVKSVIELVENEDIIIHILDKYEAESNGMRVLIGREMQHQILDDYSLIVTTYKIGSAKGSIGLIGPKRMNYPKLTSLVHYVGEMISMKQK